MPSADRVEILMYHSISNEPGVTSIPPDLFRGHLDALEIEGYEIVRLSNLMAWYERGTSLPVRTAVLTFDDGFKDFADHAFPLLHRRGWPATVFLPTGCLGGDECWTGANEPPRPLMSWEDVKDLSEHRIQFGAHSMTHPDLTGLSPSEAEREIKHSVEAIEDCLGPGARVFAPPYGKSNATVRQLVGRYCKLSVGTELGWTTRSSDLLNLPRIEMHYFRNLNVWRAYLRGEADVYLRGRAFLRRVRSLLYAVAPSHR